MIVYEYKIEYYCADRVDIEDSDHSDSLSDALDAIERGDGECQLCLVRDHYEHDELEDREHTYFVEDELSDEARRPLTKRHQREIAGQRARIAALVASGKILLDAQIRNP